MRLIHTSDWHIGRTFYGQDLLADQECVLAALADLVALHAVDVVIIAGDIYDRAVPSAQAVQVANRAFNRIRDAGAVIVASSGNHDSAPRLGAFAEFLAAGGLHLRTAVAGLATPILLVGDDGPVAIYAVPYLEPEIAKTHLELQGRPGHQLVMAAAMDLVRADLASRPPGTKSVVAAHAFVVGGVAGGSERSIAVGGIEWVTANVFDGIDYVALGHLHGAQQLGDRIRYCGSPLPYSFDEASHRKGVWMIDLAGEQELSTAWLDLPVVRPLAVLTGSLADVLVGYPELREHYVSVVLTDPIRPLEAMRRLRERFPFALKMSWEPAGRTLTKAVSSLASGTLTDVQVMAEFLLECRGDLATPAEQSLIDMALAADRAIEVQA